MPTTKGSLAERFFFAAMSPAFREDPYQLYETYRDGRSLLPDLHAARPRVAARRARKSRPRGIAPDHELALRASASLAFATGEADPRE